MNDLTAISQGCPCACCPRYEELRIWADELDEIAVRIEQDRAFYIDVKADIIENGWESEYAKIGVSGYRDPTVPHVNQAAVIQHMTELPTEAIFAEDLTPVMLNDAAAQPGLASVIRERAQAARRIAERGLSHCGGDPDYTGQDADPVLDYFCTPDPDKVDDDVWDALFEIGWIDRATWEDVGYQVVSARWARAELIASLAGLVFVWRSALTRLARSTPRGLMRIARGQAQRLANLARRTPPKKVPPPRRLQRPTPREMIDEEAGMMHGFMGVGHARPWSEMSAVAKKKFQHSYSRHAREFGLPSWRGSQAADLQAQFNAAVGRVRTSADMVRIRYKPVDGVSARVRYFEATLDGQRFYYYELLDVGRFISAGRVR